MLLLLVVLWAVDIRGSKTDAEQIPEQASTPTKVKYMQYYSPESIFLPEPECQGHLYHTLCPATDGPPGTRRGF